MSKFSISTDFFQELYTRPLACFAYSLLNFVKPSCSSEVTLMIWFQREKSSQTISTMWKIFMYIYQPMILYHKCMEEKICTWPYYLYRAGNWNHIYFYDFLGKMLSKIKIGLIFQRFTSFFFCSSQFWIGAFVWFARTLKNSVWLKFENCTTYIHLD